MAGSFTSVNGVARRGVASSPSPRRRPTLDTTFNARLPAGKVNDMHLAGGRLFIGGNFPKKLMALDPTTGADTGYVNIPITGTVAVNAGPTDIYRFAINPQGTRLVAIGNFTTVAGQVRSRAFMLDPGLRSATLNAWYYQPLAERVPRPTACPRT